MTKKILAVDTATENCSVALLIDDQIIFRSELAPREHTIKILPMVDQVLSEAEVSLSQLDGLAFGRGPGSFTGVRIGIGIAQGLGFGADLPMIGVSTLAAMAQGAYRQFGAEHVLSSIDARMSEIYWGQYQRLINGDWQLNEQEVVSTPELILERVSLDQEREWFQVGTGWQAYPDLSTLAKNSVTTELLYPDAQDMVHLAQFALARGEVVSAEDATPVYLRDTVTWKKLPGRE
ncbi:tRNA (adenosine(37)-N6)-threonylcarbamoyltransferase complex dimerization subunit type 1 TsaB [Vibrio sp. SS-MA-C1-2]|uniref:tRNA (adenosine(37)-N6)-threonylcarbamoyltransferase complex dimerization subunit type 1 TsaB n=1 Tax=Vibrio sp. SS-MA-C1-2 TaxID=2908646 RepID=UPI001F2250A3|nr:tRNA (adenosine(37)-N6)-threonylcarbamoyltransferase complex dimerization subunit type 1 TsaB [Vibrio sp. SS-MA-C1-2]UJF19931.1 tRNA (adenosine(37)-N6)-threonylcarbamoyltransferase complex dimerization subunit type 1 TsaB [Vibrio sp. SS-MA-C1-2]